MLKPRKIPQRQCLGCREMKNKKDLLRIVRAPDEGPITLDFKGKSPGRGAYVCPNLSCFAKMKKNKALERAFACPIPAEVYEQLEDQMRKENG